MIRCDHIDDDTNYSREMPCPSTQHLVEILDDLYENKEKLEATAELCYERVTDPRFEWQNIAAQLSGIFQDALNNVDHSVDKKPKPTKKKRTKRKLTK